MADSAAAHSMLGPRVLGVESSYLSKGADPTDFVDRKAVEIEIVHVGVFAACRQKPGKALPTCLKVLI